MALSAVTFGSVLRRRIGDQACDQVQSEINGALEKIDMRIPEEVRKALEPETLGNRLHQEREFHRWASHVDSKTAELSTKIEGVHRDLAEKLHEFRVDLQKQMGEVRAESAAQMMAFQSTLRSDLWKHTIAVLAGVVLALLIAVLAK